MSNWCQWFTSKHLSKMQIKLTSKWQKNTNVIDLDLMSNWCQLFTSKHTSKMQIKLTSNITREIGLQVKTMQIWCANSVHLGAIWENTALVQWIRCEPLGEHPIHWTCAVFYHIALKMNNVCIFPHDQVTDNIITAIDCSSATGRVRYGLISIYVSQWKSLHRVWENAILTLWPRFDVKLMLIIQVQKRTSKMQIKLTSKRWCLCNVETLMWFWRHKNTHTIFKLMILTWLVW